MKGKHDDEDEITILRSHSSLKSLAALSDVQTQISVGANLKRERSPAFETETDVISVSKSVLKKQNGGVHLALSQARR